MKTIAHNPFVRIAHKSIACLLVFCIVNMPVWALNAGDATVSAGNASVTNPASNTVSVDLISNRAVLDWTQMNATNAETLNFNGSSGFAVLNRVASAVDFNGTLNGIGGHVFVVSPHGIVIGPDATITAGSFTASGLNITNNDFMNSVYRFSGDGVGEVANYGHISAEQVALIGKKILNAGTIISRDGYTVLAAGESVYLSPEGSDVVIEVAGVIIPEGSEGQGIGDVVNKGTIEAIDGQIIMAAGDTFSRAIDGIEGMTVAVESGTGRVGQFGTLVTDGSVGDGGSISLTAADAVVIGSDSVTTANAGTNGDGGDIAVYSPDTALVGNGAIFEAKGGSESGNGGFVEVSGVERLFFAGDVDTTAANGETGMLLFDPIEINIIEGSGGQEDSELNDGTIAWEDFVLRWFFIFPYLDVNFEISEDKLESLNSNITLAALGDIIMEDFLDPTDNVLDLSNMGGTGNSLTIIADADNFLGGDFIMQGADDAIVTNGGNIDISGHNISVGKLSTATSVDAAATAGNVNLTARNDITVNGGIIAGDHLEMLGGQAPGNASININEDIVAGSMRIKNGKDVAPGEQSYSPVIVADGKTLTATTGGVTVQAVHDIILGGAVTAPGVIYINADEDGYGDNPSPYGGGDLIAKADITGGSHVLLKANGMYLGGDVSANGGNLIIYGRTSRDDNPDNGGGTGNWNWGDVEVAADKTLYAQNNVDISNRNPESGIMTLEGHNSLNIIAGEGTDGGASGDIFVYETGIKVTGSSLTLEQDSTLDLSDAQWDFLGSQDTTDLTLISNEDSVIATIAALENAADQWLSIGATAENNITLSGASNITLGESGDEPDLSLWAQKGNVDIIAGNGVLAQKGIDAGGTLDIIADNSIIVNGKAKSGSDMTMLAGHDIQLNATPTSADSGGMMTLTADADDNNVGDVDVEGDLLAAGNIEISASDNTIYLAGDVKTTDGDVIFNNDVIADGSGSQSFDADGNGKKLIAKSMIIKTTDGNLTLDGGWNAGYEIELDGDVTVNNGNLYLGESGSYDDETTIAPDKTLESLNGDVRIASDINGEGDLNIWAADDIRIYGDTTVADHHFEAKAGQVSGYQSVLYTENVTSGTMVLESGNRDVDGSNWDTIEVAYRKDLLTTEGDMTVRADDHITLGGDATSAANMRILANHDSDNGGIVGNATVKGSLVADGDIHVKGRNVKIGQFGRNSTGNVTANGELKIIARDQAYNGSDGDVSVYGMLKTEEGSGGDIIVKATDDIELWGSFSGGYVSADSDSDIDIKGDRGGYDYPYGGDVEVHGDLLANDNIVIDAADDTIYLGGDTIANGTIDLMANTQLNGKGDQFIDAGQTVTADGYVRKTTEGDMFLLGRGANEGGLSLDFRYVSDDETDPAISAFKGNIWMAGLKDIQISGDITTFGPSKHGWTPWTGCGECGPWETGGVLVYSLEGSIFTGSKEDGLNVNVTGSSDHWNGRGVFNPYYLTYNDEGEVEFNDYYGNFDNIAKAAVVIVSAEDLTLGPKGSLNAFGTYYDDVDDRALTNSLDVDANIGGYDRDKGDPYDWAIYARSIDGNVHVDMPTQILSCDFVPFVNGGTIGNLRVASVETLDQPDGYWEQTHKGTMVVDAYDSISFGSNFVASLENGDVGSSLEVVSRITEWLEDAVGRLPFNLSLPAGYSYVMRGAGLENSAITDGRAWVLETRVAPLQVLEYPVVMGCPPEMDAAAAELAVNSEDFQMIIANSMATNPGLQPCEACASLLTAASTLRQMDGPYVAALAQIFNTLAPIDAPYTPEVSASVETVLANFKEMESRLAMLTDEEYAEYQQHAMADKLVEAFVSYVAVLENDLKLPLGDSVAMVMDKYGDAIEATGNPNIGSYLIEQMEATHVTSEPLVASVN